MNVSGEEERAAKAQKAFTALRSASGGGEGCGF